MPPSIRGCQHDRIPSSAKLTNIQLLQAITILIEILRSGYCMLAIGETADLIVQFALADSQNANRFSKHHPLSAQVWKTSNKWQRRSTGIARPALPPQTARFTRQSALAIVLV